MKYSHSKKAQQNIGLFPLILSMFFLYFLYSVFDFISSYADIEENYQKAQIRMETAKTLNAQLHLEKENLSNLSHIEKIAREELGLTKKGEIPYISYHK